MCAVSAVAEAQSAWRAEQARLKAHSVCAGRCNAHMRGLIACSTASAQLAHLALCDLQPTALSLLDSWKHFDHLGARALARTIFLIASAMVFMMSGTSTVMSRRRFSFSSSLPGGTRPSGKGSTALNLAKKMLSCVQDHPHHVAGARRPRT